MNSKRKARLTIDACFTQKIIPYIEIGIGDSAEIVSKASVVFLQVNELVDIPEVLAPFQTKPLDHLGVMLHLDLVHGLARDEAALRYLAGFDRIDGIVTVHHHLVAPARRLGLLSILRLFLQDTRAIGRGVGIIEKSHPDAVELLPGSAAIEVVDRFQLLHVPLIAGGLVYNLNAVQRVLDSGCRAASTSNRDLWAFNDDQFAK
ncbi:MAG: glycerol-3-phosphate responsive antiterminator [Pirellulales bacterium]|nr:glycerol-3-phosphate responsive antiterminator [Pirellulales bacterium]